MKALLWLLPLSFSGAAAGQDRFTIEAVDFYGLRTVSEDRVREELPFREGDVLAADEVTSLDAMAVAAADRLGVARVEIVGVCCSDSGGWVAYVGVEETGGESPPYRPEPDGDVTLPVELTDASSALDQAMFDAVRRGEASEDTSQGHSLLEAPEGRALQQRFVGFAASYWDTLVEVLHESRDARQRAIAAQIIAYARDKAAVVPHLIGAALDSDPGVRNNATRALAVIANYANANPAAGIEIAADPFIGMLHSISQTDRNKASILLLYLSEKSDSTLASELRRRALLPLIEMCHWSWDGHSFPACRLLERALGLPEDAPPFDEEDKRRLTEAALPFLSADLRTVAERLLLR